jgi:hypothetical protein
LTKEFDKEILQIRRERVGNEAQVDVFEQKIAPDQMYTEGVLNGNGQACCQRRDGWLPHRELLVILGFFS